VPIFKMLKLNGWQQQTNSRVLKPARMRIILLQDVEKLGQKGNLKEVSDGYARNFLLPQKLAQVATPALIKEWQQDKQGEKIQKQKKHEEILALQKKLDGLEVLATVKVGESGQVFKTVGAADISKALKEKGFNIPKTKIEFEPVREPGAYEVAVNLGEGIKAKIKVIIRAHS